MPGKIKILIIDDDADEALLLAKFLTLNNLKTFIVPTIYNVVQHAIEQHLPDFIILSMSHADEDIIGLKIARYIHDKYEISVMLLIEFHEKENLQQYINTLPYSCYYKSMDNNEQILNSIHFSAPHIVPKLCKYKSKSFRVTSLEIDEKGEPISYVGMLHDFEDKEIQFCDILYFKAGNDHIKNMVLIRLKSDKEQYYAFRGSLAKCLLWLNHQYFTQINGSYIVNTEKITAWNLPNSVTVDDIVVAYSRNYKKDIYHAYENYHLKG